VQNSSSNLPSPAVNSVFEHARIWGGEGGWVGWGVGGGGDQLNLKICVHPAITATTDNLSFDPFYFYDVKTAPQMPHWELQWKRKSFPPLVPAWQLPGHRRLWLQRRWTHLRSAGAWGGRCPGTGCPHLAGPAARLPFTKSSMEGSLQRMRLSSSRSCTGPSKYENRLTSTPLCIVTLWRREGGGGGGCPRNWLAASCRACSLSETDTCPYRKNCMGYMFAPMEAAKVHRYLELASLPCCVCNSSF